MPQRQSLESLRRLVEQGAILLGGREPGAGPESATGVRQSPVRRYSASQVADLAAWIEATRSDWLVRRPGLAAALSDAMSAFIREDAFAANDTLAARLQRRLGLVHGPEAAGDGAGEADAARARRADGPSPGEPRGSWPNGARWLVGGEALERFEAFQHLLDEVVGLAELDAQPGVDTSSLKELETLREVARKATWTLAEWGLVYGHETRGRPLDGATMRNMLARWKKDHGNASPAFIGWSGRAQVVHVQRYLQIGGHAWTNENFRDYRGSSRAARRSR